MLMKILFALIALTVIVPVALYYKSGKTKGKECLLMNAISFFSILGVGVICTLGGEDKSFTHNLFIFTHCTDSS